MPGEIKTRGPKLETRVSKTFHKRFTAHCKRMEISVAQHLRDLVQADMKKLKKQGR